jgi:ABC-type Fe2+-enterobactin transport system substrate-binding protein
MNQKTQDAAARNPRWVPAVSSANGASTGAHVGTHPAAEAARVVFRFGLWLAALARPCQPRKQTPGHRTDHVALDREHLRE